MLSRGGARGSSSEAQQRGKRRLYHGKGEDRYSSVGTNKAGVLRNSGGNEHTDDQNKIYDYYPFTSADITNEQMGYSVAISTAKSTPLACIGKREVSLLLNLVSAAERD